MSSFSVLPVSREEVGRPTYPYFGRLHALPVYCPFPKAPVPFTSRSVWIGRTLHSEVPPVPGPFSLLDVSGRSIEKDFFLTFSLFSVPFLSGRALLLQTRVV